MAKMFCPDAIKDEEKSEPEKAWFRFLRPSTIDVNRPVVRSSEGRRVSGSLADTDEQIAQLQRKKEQLAKQEAEDAEIERKYQEEIRRQTEAALRELTKEAEAFGKSCPGEKTDALCPCYQTLPTFSTSFVVKRRPDGLDNPITVQIANPAYYLRKQKDGSLLCPRCGRQTIAY